MLFRTLIIFASSCSLASSLAVAEDCGSYPFGRGQDVISVEGSDMPKNYFNCASGAIFRGYFRC